MIATPTSPQAAAAALRVAPVVRTSSTSTAPRGARETARNRRPSRRRTRSWLRWSRGARSMSASGRPATRARAAARARPGSIPNLARRGNDRGTGTRAAASNGSRSTIRGARPAATRSTPRYFKAWMAPRTGPSWNSNERTSKPDESRTSPARCIEASQAGQRAGRFERSFRYLADGFHQPHTTHTMPRGCRRRL